MMAVVKIIITVTNGTKYSRMDQGKVFKGCLPQILLGPFLNTLSQILMEQFDSYTYIKFMNSPLLVVNFLFPGLTVCTKISLLIFTL